MSSLSSIFQVLGWANEQLNRPLFIIAAMAAGGVIWQRMREHEALSKNIFKGSQAIYSMTTYEPTDRFTPAGKRIYRQHITTLDDSLDTGLIFHKLARRKSMNALRDAAQLCDAHCPSVQAALRKLNLDPELVRLINKRWTNYFSKKENEATGWRVRKKRSPNEAFVYEPVYVAMVNEVDIDNRQIRIIRMTEDDVSGFFPDKDQVEFETRDGQWILVPTPDNKDAYEQSLRWDTHNSLRKWFQDSPYARADTRVRVCVGKKSVFAVAP